MFTKFLLHAVDARARRRSCGLVICALASLLVAAAATAADRPLGGIAAVVNERLISIRDVSARLSLMRLDNQAATSARDQRRMARRALTELIEEEIKLQEAERLTPKVSATDLAKAWQTIAQNNKLSVEDLRRKMTGQGVDPETLTRRMRAEILWSRAVAGSTCVWSKSPTAKSTRRWPSPRPRATSRATVCRKSFCAAAPKVWMTCGNAPRNCGALRDGANFADLARQYSEAPSAEAGGAIGWIPRGRLPPILGSAVAECGSARSAPLSKRRWGSNCCAWTTDKPMSRPTH